MRVFLVLLAVGLLIGAVVLFGGGFAPGEMGSTDDPAEVTTTEGDAPSEAPVASTAERVPTEPAADPTLGDEPTLPPVTGVVVDVLGSPIADALLSAPGDEDPMTARSGADGTFSLVPVSVAPFALECTAPRHAARVVLDVRAGDHQLIILTEGVGVVGRVVDAETDEGLSGARIQFALSSAHGEPTVRSDATGRFSIVLPEPTHALEVNCDGYHVSTLYALSPSQVGDDWTVRLVPEAGGRTLYYRVTDRETGRAVADVVFHPGPSASLGEGLYSGGAWFHFGRRRARIGAPGFVEQNVTFEAPYGDAPDAAMEVRLTRDVEVTGRLVADAGGPVAGARIGILRTRTPDGKGAPHFTTTGESGADGTFRLGGLEGRSVFRITIEPDDFAPMTLEDRVAPEVGAWDLGDLTLDPGLTISGRAIDASDATPVSGAAVRFGDRGSISDGTGSFLVDHVAIGGELRVEARGYVPESVVVTSDETLEVPLSRGLAIRGVVVGPDDTRLAGAAVSARPTAHGSGRPVHTICDIEGRFEIPGLAAGPYALNAGRREWLQAEHRSVEAGTDDVRLRLAPPSGVVGRVVSARDGAPLPRFEYEVAWDNGRKRASSITDGTGTFFTPLQPEEIVDVSAWAGGFARVTFESVSVAAGEVREYLFALVPASGVEGVVWSDQGRPVSQVQVRLSTDENPNGFALATSTSDDRGRYRIGDLTEGVYRLRAHAVGEATETPLVVDPESITLGVGQTKQVDLTVSAPAGPEVSGTVTLPDDPRRLGATLRLQPTAGSGSHDETRCRLDSDGRFTIARLSPGPYVLRLELSRTTAGGSMTLSLNPEPYRIEIPDTATFECVLSGDYEVPDE